VELEVEPDVLPAGAGRLRILVANENQERLEVVAAVVTAAGHDVVARSVEISAAAAAVAEEEPDVAIVAPGESDEHALELVAGIADESTCPIVLFMPKPDPGLVAAAARMGVFGQLTGTDPDELQGELEIVLRRYDEHRRLEQAFRRRALIERAKGVLMERHSVSEADAFALLRNQARRTGTPVVGVAQGLLGAHPLLPASPTDGRPES
jgi:response regulator NasT